MHRDTLIRATTTQNVFWEEDRQKEWFHWLTADCRLQTVPARLRAHRAVLYRDSLTLGKCEALQGRPLVPTEKALSYARCRRSTRSNDVGRTISRKDYYTCTRGYHTSHRPTFSSTLGHARRRKEYMKAIKYSRGLYVGEKKKEDKREKTYSLLARIHQFTVRRNVHPRATQQQRHDGHSGPQQPQRGGPHGALRRLGPQLQPRPRPVRGVSRRRWPRWRPRTSSRLSAWRLTTT